MSLSWKEKPIGSKELKIQNENTFPEDTFLPQYLTNLTIYDFCSMRMENTHNCNALKTPWWNCIYKYKCIMYKCISAVIRLKSPRSEVTKQVDWESVINLVFVYLRPTAQGPTILWIKKSLVYLSMRTMHMIAPRCFHSILPTNHMSHNFWNMSVDLWTFFSTVRWDLRKANHQESIVRSNCVESNLVKSGEDEQRQLGLVAQKTSFHLDLLLAPDPKCFPTPSILKLPF